MTRTDPYTMPERKLMIAGLISLSHNPGWPADQRQAAVDLSIKIARQKPSKPD